METTALQGTTKPINLDAIALQAATEIMAIDHGALVGGECQLKAFIQVIVRDAIASATSNSIAVYWHERSKEQQKALARAGEELARAQRALRHAGFADTMLGWKASPGSIEDVRSQLAQMEEVKDGAYHERNQVVAALAKCFPSGIAKTAIEGWDPAWHNCVYIDLPTGQASWHYHDDSAHLFAGLPPYTRAWDGHSTPTKYTRLAALESIPQVYEIDYSVQLRLQGRPVEGDEPIDLARMEEPLRFYTFKATAQEVIAAGLDALRKASTCTLFPARTVRLHFNHDTVGDGRYTGMMYQAMREMMETDPNAVGDTMAYVASNGVRIIVESLPQMMEDELIEGKALKK